MYSKAYISTHWWVPRHEVKRLGVWKDTWTIRSYFDDREFRIYRLTKNWFGVPLNSRFQSFFGAHGCSDRRTIGELFHFNLKTELWEGQSKVMAEFSDLLKQDVTNFVLGSPTGSGKTVMMLDMLQKIGRTALIIVPVSNLVKQWRDRIAEHTDISDDRIGSVEEGKADFEGKDVVIGLVHSVVKDRWGDEFNKRFGVIAYDELHTVLPPETFGPSITMFPTRYRIGASATLQRKDGLHKIYDEHIGEVRLFGPDEGRMKPEVYGIAFDGWSGSIPSYITTKIGRRGHLISLLAENEERNRLIAERIMIRVLEGHRVLVLSDRISQLRWLESGLGIKCGLYVRSFETGEKTKAGNPKKQTISAKRREAIAKDVETRVILATYGMIRLGTDIKDLSALTLATPQSDPRQSKGRIERELEGKLDPVIDDWVDTYYDETYKWWNERKREYKRENLTIRTIE